MRLAAVVLIAACGGSTTTSGKLELVDAGAEPRVKLQYTLGAIERDVAFVSDVEDPPQQRFADMRYHVRCSPGSCRYQMVKFEVMGQGSDFDRVKKEIRGTIRMPANGLVSITTDTAMTSTPSTPELFKTAIVPLPADAIGVGARWKVSDQDGTRTLRLVKVVGSTLTIETRAEAANAQMGITVTGELTVKLSDPFGTGTLAIVQTLARDPSLKMDAISMHQKMTLE
jgi:hypothetical protein